jgi:hypothetical protein
MHKHTLGSICLLLDITHGANRPDIKYLIDSCNTPEHFENLLNKGFDCRITKKRAYLPFSASEYIINDIFKHPITK